jgi:hypothetical protein
MTWTFLQKVQQLDCKERFLFIFRTIVDNCFVNYSTENETKKITLGKPVVIWNYDLWDPQPSSSCDQELLRGPQDFESRLLSTPGASQLTSPACRAPCSDAACVALSGSRCRHDGAEGAGPGHAAGDGGLMWARHGNTTGANDWHAAQDCALQWSQSVYRDPFKPRILQNQVRTRGGAVTERLRAL